jgi:hypothetical protein
VSGDRGDNRDMSAAGANDFEVPWRRMTIESLATRGRRHAHRCFVMSAVGSAAANNSRSHG